MPYTPPTLAEFKERFDRDFAFASDQTDMTSVRDTDINRGFNQAAATFNEALWDSQASYAEAFLLLSAHYLVTNIFSSSQGLAGFAAGDWLRTGKSVGNVQESFAIPDRMLKSPFLALLSKTTYGAQYLTLIAPKLAGNMAGLYGRVSAD